jgi:hypothetical protein
MRGDLLRCGDCQGVASADYDNDGRPDSTCPVATGRTCFRNAVRRERTEPKARSLVDATRTPASTTIYSFPTWFFDYDNDGTRICLSGFKIENVGDVAADYLGRPLGELPRLYRTGRRHVRQRHSRRA